MITNMAILQFSRRERQPVRSGLVGLGLFATLSRSEQHRRVRILAKAMSLDQVAAITRLQRDEVASIVDTQS